MRADVCNRTVVLTIQYDCSGKSLYFVISYGFFMILKTNNIVMELIVYKVCTHSKPSAKQKSTNDYLNINFVIAGRAVLRSTDLRVGQVRAVDVLCHLFYGQESSRHQSDIL